MKKIRIILFVLVSSALPWYGCVGAPTPTPVPISEKTNVELIQLLEDTAKPDYDASLYPRYVIVAELEKRGPSAFEAAPALARSMAFKERGSYQASSALIAIGPSAKSAIPYLLQNLENSREEVRQHSVFVLGILGEPASCAVPTIASLLWDKDPYVRSISAGALTEITGNELVEYDDLKLDPALPGSANPDDPDGSISGIARTWWLQTGQNITWPVENCVVPE